MRDAFIKVLLNEARKDPSIFLITGDLGFGVLEEFASELPNQFLNSGVNEQAMMGMAAGIASTGKRVFVYSIANFPTFRCLEQIRNDICLMNNSVVIVSLGAGYAYGSLGYTHHALEDVAVMRALPNMEVVVPADPFETALVTEFLTKTKKPSYLRLGKSNEPNIHKVKPNIEYGKFNEVIHGDSGTLLFVGSIGVVAELAREEILERGYSVSVASVPFLSNLDKEYLENAARKGPIITIEEHSIRGGFGSAILEFLNIEKITARVGMIAADQKDLSLTGSQDFLRISNGITSSRIANEFTKLVESQR